MTAGGQPIMVMNQNAKRETGSIARANNIAAAKAVSDIIRTTLGPRSMLKMILDASGGTGDAMRAANDDAFVLIF
jgi:T-complex protein 1 subunit gamma